MSTVRHASSVATMSGLPARMATPRGGSPSGRRGLLAHREMA